MDYVKPADVAKTMVETGARKLALPIGDLVLRGMLSGAILGVATSLAFTGAFSTGQPLVGALIFPVGLIIIVLLGLELVTGSFALVPLPVLHGSGGGGGAGAVIANWGWVFLGAIEPARIVAAAEAKTTGYAAYGLSGLVTVFVKAMLCNWMVSLAVVLPMTTTSTMGKIAAAWMPVFTFFAPGFEHSVVNMFLIPTGMMMGAKVTVADWGLWNQIPVTLGNIVGGFFFTGFALYFTHTPAAEPARMASAARVPAE
jgi:formate/nitrite transporter FocA (FNT family)